VKLAKPFSGRPGPIDVGNQNNVGVWAVQPFLFCLIAINLYGAIK
jgi:hypothetical protein